MIFSVKVGLRTVPVAWIAAALLLCPFHANGKMEQMEGRTAANPAGTPTIQTGSGTSAGKERLLLGRDVKGLELVLSRVARQEARGNPSLPPSSYSFESFTGKPGQAAPPPANPDLPTSSRWWYTLKLLAAFCVAATGLTFVEWRWMVHRQSQLRTLVEERTQELEAEKAELMRAKAALVVLASRDSLTGLYNRRTIFEMLEHELKRARRERSELAVAFADLDHFKVVNDTYGHLAGDDVLREFAGRILGGLRPYDNVGRFGGEELLILMPGLMHESHSRISDLHERVSRSPFALKDEVVHVTCSFGVAWFSESMDSVEALLSAADEALYAAKANGRNRVEMAARIPVLTDGRLSFGEILSPGDSFSPQLLTPQE